MDRHKRVGERVGGRLCYPPSYNLESSFCDSMYPTLGLWEGGGGYSV